MNDLKLSRGARDLVENGERGLDLTLDESSEMLIDRETMWEWTAAEAA